MLHRVNRILTMAVLILLSIVLITTSVVSPILAKYTQTRSINISLGFKPGYVEINWKSLHEERLMRSQWLTDIGQSQNDYDSKFTVTATETALTSAPKGGGDDRLYFSTKMYEITSDTSYEYTFEAKNDRAGYYAGVIFAYDITGKFPYLAFGEFDNRSVDGKNCIYYRRGHFDELNYDCVVNEGELFNEKVNETNDGYGQYKVIYEGLNVKFCYLNTSGEYVQLGKTIELPPGSKVCVGVYSPVNQYIGGECCTVSLKNCVLTAKNYETINCLQGEIISLVKTFNLKVATFDINKAASGIDSIVEAIKASGAEIIGLQKVHRNVPSTGYVDQAAEIAQGLVAQGLGNWYYMFFKAVDVPEGGEYGVAIISKYPILGNGITYLSSGTGEQRILARAGMIVDNEVIQFFVTHLSPYSELGQEDRKLQFTEVANTIAELAKWDDVILMGNFNTDTWGDFNPIVEKGFLLVNKSDSDMTYTNKYEGRDRAFDNIVHSNIFTSSASDRNVIYSDASDHYLLYTTLTYDEARLPMMSK